MQEFAHGGSGIANSTMQGLGDCKWDERLDQWGTPQGIVRM